jgi:hypothetical protein
MSMEHSSERPERRRLARKSPAWVLAHLTMPAVNDPVRDVQRMREAAGSISIGFEPRKADYRDGWRYSAELRDDEG